MTVNTQLQMDRDLIAQYSQSAQEPAWMLELRQEALTLAGTLPLPHVEKTKIEKWNFTQFKPFTQETAIQDLKDLPPSIAEWVGENDENILVQSNASTIFHKQSSKLKEQGVIFTDLQTALREHADLVQKYFMKAGIEVSQSNLTALHTALWSGGVFLYVPKNTVVEEPILALFALTGEGNGMVPHVLIVAEDNSRVAYVEKRLSAKNSVNNVHNGITEVFVGSGAKVTFAGLNSFAEQTVDFSKRIAYVKRDGRIEWAIGETGDGNSVSETFTILQENGASVDSKMISIGTGEQKGNFTTRAIHVGKHTESELLSKGVLLDQAAQVFSGITKIEKGATKANGEQTERLLMLSKQARGDANPILLIDEDDVKCGHAASVGRIDEIQLYYLMSRGISRREAEKLIIRGFLDPVVAEIPLESVQNRLNEAIERKLSR